MAKNINDLVDEHLFATLMDEGSVYLSKLQQNKNADYDEKIYNFKLVDFFLDENESLIDGEFQQLRFKIFKHFLCMLKVNNLVPGFSGFDLVYQHDDHNELFILVDKWKDLDDELIAILYHKCQAYLERNPQDKCTIVEMFGQQGISQGWSGGDPEVDSKLSWISRDELFKKIVGEDISAVFIEAISKLSK